MTPATINLAKALKLKNRLAGRIGKLDGDIQLYNCVADGRERLDVPALLEERGTLVRQIVDLKAAISEANRPIQRVIYELAELKGLVELLSRLNTNHGPMVEGYGGVTINYTAQLRKGTVDREVRRLETEIDRIQDRLDTFNHETTIAIDPGLLDAGA